ncbi:MlaE family ABC transporter permease [Polluticaenibacter yanchengensis]|uniref:ABC transporter permease n=1 Tax=Polluticaenibacter yanchengensis TaxID=3014562 RepID=A0ABT4UJN1_9BACT|nr:ABC transporter permease [Chitinophagaceae bacterium LY-5]
MNVFTHLGKYTLTIKGMFSKPENAKMYWKELMKQCMDIGIGSLPIVLIISVFLGAVMTVQTAYQLVADFIPKTTIAVIVRDSMMLELSPTVISLVLAGVVGSKIASELGNMRISEQIDALEIMGINTRSYLIAPKIMASMLTVPLLISLSIFVALLGGRFTAQATGIMDVFTFDEGLRSGFNGFNVWVAMIKAIVFAYIFSSVPAYFGYNVRGGALEIGRSSTLAVVVSCILILLADYVVTLIMLNAG